MESGYVGISFDRATNVYVLVTPGYLMVPHTDIGADCVVNDAPLTVLSLKTRTEFGDIWT